MPVFHALLGGFPSYFIEMVNLWSNINFEANWIARNRRIKYLPRSLSLPTAFYGGLKQGKNANCVHMGGNYADEYPTKNLLDPYRKAGIRTNQKNW